MSSNSWFVYWNSVWQRLTVWLKSTYCWCFAPRFAKGFEYRNIASTNMSHLEPRPGIYRLVMKGKLAVYELWRFGEKLISLLVVTHINTRNFTVKDQQMLICIRCLIFFPNNEQTFYHAPKRKVDVLGFRLNLMSPNNIERMS